MKKSINSAKKLAFGMWCGVKVVASCCIVRFYMMNSVPNFFDRLSCQYIHMYRKISLFRQCILDFSTWNYLQYLVLNYTTVKSCVCLEMKTYLHSPLRSLSMVNVHKGT